MFFSRAKQVNFLLWHCLNFKEKFYEKASQNFTAPTSKISINL